MTTTETRFARYLAAPIISVGIFAGTLGLAGVADAGTYSLDPTPRVGLVATPGVKAQPAPDPTAGWPYNSYRPYRNLPPAYHP